MLRLEHFSTSNVSFFKWKAQYSVGDFCNVKNSFLVEHFHSGADRGAEDVVGSSSASVTTTGPRVCLPPGEQVQISMAVAAVPPCWSGAHPWSGAPAPSLPPVHPRVAVCHVPAFPAAPPPPPHGSCSYECRGHTTVPPPLRCAIFFDFNISHVC